MKQRSQSAIGIAFVGLLPAIIGGPVWAIAITVLGLIGFHEFLAIAGRLSHDIKPVGYAILPLFALATFIDRADVAILGAVALAFMLPLAEATLRADLRGSVTDWALGTAGTIYLGLPIYAAIELRSIPGPVDATWLSDLAETLSFGWDANPRGLAWLTGIILMTWMADSFAYIVGRQFGKHKFSPVVSPNKTLEGLAGGIAGAAVTGAIVFIVFGIDDRWWIGLALGAILAIVGLFGDLAESVLKRQAGVKDSSSLIPGHGGMLDRLDALLFTFVAGLYLVILVDHYVL
ncbi:phosphatidate cytidylyltransferase [soil metagenome]